MSVSKHGVAARKALGSVAILLTFANSGCSGAAQVPGTVAQGQLTKGSGAGAVQNLPSSTPAPQIAHKRNRGPLPPVVDADIDKHIDNGLPKHDKQIMRKLIENVAPD